MIVLAIKPHQTICCLLLVRGMGHTFYSVVSFVGLLLGGSITPTGFMGQPSCSSGCVLCLLHESLFPHESAKDLPITSAGEEAEASDHHYLSNMSMKRQLSACCLIGNSPHDQHLIHVCDPQNIFTAVTKMPLLLCGVET